MSGNGPVDIMSFFNKAQSDNKQQNSVQAFFQQAAEVENMRNRQNSQQTVDSLEQIEQQLRQTNGNLLILKLL